MASGSITVKSPTKTVATYIGWSSSSNGSAANTSKVTATVYFRKTNGYTTRGTFAGNLKIDGTSYSISRYGTWAGSYIAIGSKSKTVTHNSDGKKSITISTTYSNSGTDQAGTYTGSGTAVLDTIPRASSISSSASWTAGNALTVNISRNASSFTHTVTVKVGSTTVGTATGVGTSVKFSNAAFQNAVFNALAQTASKTATITLTTYSGSTSIGSKSVSGTVTALAASSFTCLDSVNIGGTQQIKITKGASSLIHSLKYEFRGKEGYLLGGSGSGAADESVDWDLDSGFYPLITDAVEDTCKLTLTSYYKADASSSPIQVRTPVEKSFKIKVTDSAPLFADFTYKDINTVSRALTGSDSIFIEGYSNVEACVDADNKASARNSAQMKSYTLQIGSQTSSAPYSDTEDVSISINKVTSGDLSVTAYDSRGLSAKVTKSAVLKAYRPVSIASAGLERQNGVDTQTKLIMDVKLWDESFGAVENGIVSCSYRYKKSSEGSAEWVTGSTEITKEDFEYMENEAIYHLEKFILGDDENGFALANSYDVEVSISDRLESAKATASIASGYPGIYLKRNESSGGEVGYQVGVNCVPEESMGSGLHVQGDAITLNGSSVFAATPVGAVTGWFSDSVPANWLLLNGQAVSRTGYSELFEILGTAYGEGDGESTFNLPNLCGRVPVGKSSDTEFKTLGNTGGEKTHKLAATEMPSHTHSVSGTAASAGAHTHLMAGIATRKAGSWNGCVASAGCSDTAWTSARSAGAHTHSVSGTAAATGGGGAHNNLQPYIVLNYIIKAK